MAKEQNPAKISNKIPFESLFLTTAITARTPVPLTNPFFALDDSLQFVIQFQKNPSKKKNKNNIYSCLKNS